MDGIMDIHQHNIHTHTQQTLRGNCERVKSRYYARRRTHQLTARRRRQRGRRASVRKLLLHMYTPVYVRSCCFFFFFCGGGSVGNANTQHRRSNVRALRIYYACI